MPHANSARYFSCFLCYGHPDLAFAKKLVADLETHGVSCWFYAKDATPGARTQEEITRQRREAEKVIALCSYQSLIQDGVLSEIDDQIREDPDKLIPISLDDVWQHPGFRVIWGPRDLKPLLLERNYSDFRDESLYGASLGRLLGALRRESKAISEEILVQRLPEVSAAEGKVLEQRVAGIARLLKLRGDAKDLSFAPQILDELATVVILKFRLLPNEELDEPRVYLKLMRALNTFPPSSTAMLQRALKAQAVEVRELLRFLTDISTVINRDDTSLGAIERVQNRLSRLYALVGALVSEETDAKAVEAKVQASQQESDYIEYKASLRYNLATQRIDKQLEVEVIKTIAGLANHQGGTLYIGVNDTGEIVGTDPDLSTFRGRNPMDNFRRHFDQLVAEHFGVHNYQIVEADWAEPEGKKVFVVKVKPASTPTFADGDFYVRRGARTLKLGPQPFFEYYKARWAPAPTEERAP